MGRGGDKQPSGAFIQYDNIETNGTKRTYAFTSQIESLGDFDSFTMVKPKSQESP